MRNTSRKYFVWSLIFVFITGIFGGAFLVLRSAVTRGELINSTPLSQGKSSDQLLEELLKLNQTESQQEGEYVQPENRNITEGFLKEVVGKTGESKIDPQVVASDDFFLSTILPYLKSSQITLFPLIPDSVFKIVPDSKANFSKYFQDTNKDAAALFKIMSAVLETDAEKLDDTEVLNGLAINITDLGSTFQNLSKASVPKKYLTLHKNILLTAYSLQKFSEALLNIDQDPLKSLLITNEYETLGEFWQKAITEYDKTSRIR